MRIRTQSTVVTLSEAPTIDPIEARWAAEAVGSLSRQLSADSIVGMVLAQAQRELSSLATSSAPSDADILGPVRVRVAA
ncbi:MAG: hypothetical protein MUF18_19255 [Fimbriiglobus sp.]|jgi:hypothetical protein|nr:hypothetical protein [Fimbriiglobus sp.]